LFNRPLRLTVVAIDLKKLSARLGLSPTTVSRALNGYTDVSEATRARVVQMASELGYQPNLGARRLAMGRADAIGIVYPVDTDFLGNPAFLEMIAGVSDRLEAAGMDLLLAAAREQSELRTYERLVRGRRVDGLIVAHTRVVDPRIDYLMQSRMPFVAYGRTASPDDFAWFDFDNELGGELAVRHLALLGHKRIGYIHAPLTYNFAQQRYAGFVRGLQAAGLPNAPELMVVGSMNRRGGYEACGHLLGLKRRPTAVVVDNNVGGIGVMRALLQAGVEIGRDVSVVVYGGMPVDTLLIGEEVAAIRQPTSYTTGTKIADMMLTLIEGGTLEQRHVLWQPEFVSGTSIGPAPAS
jgi:LacI family transcriptional regulator